MAMCEVDQSLILVVSQIIFRLNCLTSKLEAMLMNLYRTFSAYIYKFQNLISVKQCSIHRSKAEYIYCLEEKTTNKLQVHP